MPFGKYAVKIIGTKEIAPGIMGVWLEKPADFVYTAGQFITVSLPQLLEKGPKEARRSMSLASAPREASLMLAMRMSDSLFKQTLARLASGVEIGVEGPFGHMMIGENSAPVVLLAGGIGIVPFRSMISEQNLRGWPTDLTLFYSARTVADAVFLGEMTKMENVKFRVVATMTRLSADDVWSGERGRISGGLLEKYVKNFTQNVYYIVGVPEMVKATKAILLTFQVPVEKIKVELFSGYEN